MKSAKFALVVAAALCGALATPTAASAAPIPHQFCASIVSKELDSAGLSKVLSTSCSNVSAVDAYSGVSNAVGRSSVRTAAPASAAASTLLMNEYLNDNLGGGVIYSFYGTSGTCDADGYRLRNTSGVGSNTSSIQGNGACNRVKIQGYNSTAEGTFTLTANNLGPTYNDNVNLVRVYHG